jgi:hypothetical protein
LELGGHPTKVLFVPSVTIVDESEGSKDLEIEGKKLTVTGFVPRGLALDDHGSQIHVKFYVLDGEAI